MDFEFSEDQELLRDSVRRYLLHRAPIAAVRAALDAPAAVDDAWRGLADLGLTGMLAPESAGGAEMGMVDLALALEEMGRAVFPGPFTASAVGAIGLLADLPTDAVAAEWLPLLTSGARVGTVALTDARADPVHLDDRGRISGTMVHVPDGVAADLLLVATDSPDTPVVAVSREQDGVDVAPIGTVDGTRKFATVSLAGAEAQPLGGSAPDACRALAATRDRLAVAFVLDGVGAASRALELALEYARQREQFGRAIGSFQAVQHLCADMLRAVELGRAAAYYAAWACDAADVAERHRAATIAAAFAADGFYRVGANAVQVFGGIGFTWEHDIHLFYKRLLTLQLFQGTASDHLEELASIVL